jgi:hypothetical protein
MSNESETSHTGRREPYRVRLPGFIGEETVGLGDVIKRVTSIVGSSRIVAATNAPVNSTRG